MLAMQTHLGIHALIASCYQTVRAIPYTLIRLLIQIPFLRAELAFGR